MKQRVNAVRVGSSHNTERLAELKANHERLQEMLANGWQVKSIKVERPKRPRIKKEKKSFKLFGTLECKFEIPLEILIKAGFAK